MHFPFEESGPQRGEGMREGHRRSGPQSETQYEHTLYPDRSHPLSAQPSPPDSEPLLS